MFMISCKHENLKLVILLGISWLAAPTTSPAQNQAPLPGESRQMIPSQAGEDDAAKLATVRPDARPMPIVVAPWYHFQGPLVKVGRYGIGLASRDPKVVLNTISEMSRAWTRLRAEAMFVAAIRLHDLGLKDDAFFWFQAAKHRSLLVITALAPEKKISPTKDPAFEIQMGFGTFRQLVGKYINVDTFGDRNRAIAIIQNVQNANRAVPDLAKAYPELTFIQQAAWEKKNREALDVFNRLIDDIRENAAPSRGDRVNSGVEGKY